MNKFYFRASVYGQPKGQPTDPLTTPESCGEDSFFIYEKNQKVYSTGMADGVGGWNELGFNPAIISRKLMKYAHENYNNNQLPQELLEIAYNKVKNDEEIEGGGTTCCIITLDYINNKPIIRSSNVGDSGYIIIRNGKIIVQSLITRTLHGSPHQLSIIPRSHQGLGIVNTAIKDSVIEFHYIQKGDIIILATDGLWDNVYDKDNFISEIKDTSMDIMAKKIVEYAISCDIKPDDITVIVLELTE